MKIAVITDSASNIYNTDIDMVGLYRLPLQIGDDNDIYLEGENASPQQIYDIIAQGKILKTSLPPLGRIEELMQQIKEEGYEMIYAVPITSGLSSTIEAMASAAQQVGIAFEAFDSYSTFDIVLHMATVARTMFDQGYEVAEVNKKLIECRDHSSTFVVPNDLKHLAKSGRLTAFAAGIAGLLKIKPVLQLGENTGGKIDSISKPRTMTKAFAEIVDLFIKEGVDKSYQIVIAHVRNLEMAIKFQEMLEERIKDADIFITDLITTVGVHTGIGCVATQYYKKITID